jgi:hypothetical protein
MTLQSKVKFSWKVVGKGSIGKVGLLVTPDSKKRHEMHEDGTAGQLTPAGTCAESLRGIFFCFAVAFGCMQVIVHGTLFHLLLQGV